MQSIQQLHVPKEDFKQDMPSNNNQEQVLQKPVPELQPLVNTQVPVVEPSAKQPVQEIETPAPVQARTTRRSRTCSRTSESEEMVTQKPAEPVASSVASVTKTPAVKPVEETRAAPPKQPEPVVHETKKATEPVAEKKVEPKKSEPLKGKD